MSISNDTIYLTGGSYVKLPAGFSGDYNALINRPTLFSGDYDSLTNKPTIPVVPDSISAFVNDVGYITSFSEEQALSISNDTIYLTGGSYVKLPAGFSGDYNALINKPTLFSGDYDSLTNKPTIPVVPDSISAFVNDAGYLTSYTETQVLSISNDTVFLTGGSFVKLPSGFSGDYNDLANTPTIPTVPDSISAFVNDAGYLTSYAETQVLSISNDTVYLTGGSFVKLPAGFSGDYNDLTNKPTLFSGDYDSLTNKPTIPVLPDSISAFVNDAGYITSYSETQTLADVATLGNSVNTQIKNLSDPTENLDAVNLQSMNNALQEIIHRYDSIIAYQQRIIDTLSRVTNIAGEAFDSNGASYAVFSVSPTKKVRFSKGNLQYTRVGSHSVQGGGSAPGTWRFAPNQWDRIGTGNSNASNPSYTGYLDLFYPGTSGWDNQYPYSSTSYGGDYSGSNVNSDWGVYNAISNGGDTPGMWKTLTQAEWDYLLNTREISFMRQLVATVNDVPGVLIFPDEYSHPAFVPNIQSNSATYSTNTFTSKQFEYMERAGCVFLPNAGYRSNSSIEYIHQSYYSTATNNVTLHITGGTGSLFTTLVVVYERGNSVRLVQDCEE